MIGSLLLEIGIGCVDILLEAAVMSNQLDLSSWSYHEKVLHIMGYMRNHNKMRLMVDSINITVNESWFKEYNWFKIYLDAEEAKPPNMPEEGWNYVTVSCFIDNNHNEIKWTVGVKRLFKISQYSSNSLV